MGNQKLSEGGNSGFPGLATEPSSSLYLPKIKTEEIISDLERVIRYYHQQPTCHDHSGGSIPGESTLGTGVGVEDPEGAEAPYLERLTHTHPNINNDQNLSYGLGSRYWELIDDKYFDWNSLNELHEWENLIYLDYYVKLIEPPESYVKFIHWYLNTLDMFGSGLTQYEVKTECGADFSDFDVMECKDHGTEVWKPQFCNVGKYSPIHHKKTTESSTSRLVKNLKKLATKERKDQHDYADYLIGFDLTVPKVFISHLPPDEAEAFLKDLAKQFINKKLRYRYLRKGSRKRERLGTFFNVHLWSTDNPHDQFAHIHLNLVNSVYSLDDQSFKRFKPPFKYEEKNSFRADWGDVLEDNGVFFFNTRDNLPVVHVQNISFFSSKFAHRIKYCSRKPIVDFFDYYSENPFTESELNNEEYYQYLLNYINTRHVLGYLTYLKKLVPRDPPGYDRTCPICGSQAKLKRQLSSADLSLNPSLLEGIKLVQYCKSSRNLAIWK